MGVLMGAIAREVVAQGELAGALMVDLSNEYDFLDDFSRRTMRLKVVAVVVPPMEVAIPTCVRAAIDSLRRAGVLMERLFYRLSSKDGRTVLTMWGMEAL